LINSWFDAKRQVLRRSSASRMSRTLWLYYDEQIPDGRKRPPQPSVRAEALRGIVIPEIAVHLEVGRDVHARAGPDHVLGEVAFTQPSDIPAAVEVDDDQRRGLPLAVIEISSREPV
jgi:hypothetical protein